MKGGGTSAMKSLVRQDYIRNCQCRTRGHLIGTHIPHISPQMLGIGTSVEISLIVRSHSTSDSQTNFDINKRPRICCVPEYRRGRGSFIWDDENAKCVLVKMFHDVSSQFLHLVINIGRFSNNTAVSRHKLR